MVRQRLGDGIGPGGREPSDGIAQLAQAAREVQGDHALIFHDEDAGGGRHPGLLPGTEPSVWGGSWSCARACRHRYKEYYTYRGEISVPVATA
jgi:hypothetical protein